VIELRGQRREPGTDKSQNSAESNIDPEKVGNLRLRYGFALDGRNGKSELREDTDQGSNTKNHAHQPKIPRAEQARQNRCGQEVQDKLSRLGSYGYEPTGHRAVPDVLQQMVRAEMLHLGCRGGVIDFRKIDIGAQTASSDASAPLHLSN